MPIPPATRTFEAKATGEQPSERTFVREQGAEPGNAGVGRSWETVPNRVCE